MTKNLKLTAAQSRVMHLMSKGWPATMNGRNSIQINGERVCNIDTITVLIRAGLVEEDGKWQWKATTAGRAWPLETASGKGCSCRRCGRDLGEMGDEEYQERLEINFRAGYGSVFGDENVVRSTFCQHCVKEMLGPWLEVIADDSRHRVAVGQPAGAYQPHQISLPGDGTK